MTKEANSNRSDSSGLRLGGVKTEDKFGDENDTNSHDDEKPPQEPTASRSKNETDDAGVAHESAVAHATDDSSELSELGEDSEAETDQMDFLEDGDSESKKLDLRALSDLTEMARMQGVDSDDDDMKRLDDEVSDEHEISLNPKDNEAASREIMDDIDSIHQQLGLVTRGEKRPSLADEAAKKKPKREEDDTDEVKKEHELVKQEINDEDGDEGNEGEDEGEEGEDGEDGELGANGGNGHDDEKVSSKNGESGAAKGLSAAEEAEAEDEDESNDESNEEEDADMSEKRQAAVAELIDIEKAFAQLRDKMYHDKLNLLEHELQLCIEGSHPELSKIYYKINAFHQDALRLANSNLSYRLKCIDRETIATRTAVHQDFLKLVYDSKSDIITNTTSSWYKINRERNQLDQLVPDYSYTASVVTTDSGDEHVSPAPQSVLYELVSQRNAINQQLGILDGIVEFAGIPAAVGSNLNDKDPMPELLLRKATNDEIADDMRAMGMKG